jgi:hypothetical protein
MVPQRTAYDPLEFTTAPRWYVVRTMHGAVVESRELPEGADLKRLFVASILEWMDAGWQLGEFASRSGTFFCNRHAERRMVSISPTDPHNERGSMYGPSYPGGCPTCQD